ncbi:DNA polymerase delta subunit 3 [Monosporozyma servazzii]
MTSEYIEYINDELFNKSHSVIFTDLMNKFKIGSSNAKEIMYNYYRTTTTMKFNLVIIMCFKDGTVKVISDLNDHGDADGDDLVDCFIYAFNPNDEFIPINDLKDETGSNLITNPYKLVSEGKASVKPVVAVPVKRSQTDSKVGKSSFQNNTNNNNNNNNNNNSGNDGSSSIRSKTEPASNKTVETAKPKKSTGLRSTEILAKMRKARETKETERQNELKQIREEENANRLQQLNKDPKRKAQMEDLNKLFVDSDDDMDIDEPKKQEEEGKTEKREKEISAAELEGLLDTTAEESLLAINKDETLPGNSTREEEVTSEPEEVKKEETNGKATLGDESIEEITSSYVDKDGYIVTKRQQPVVQTNKSPSKAKSNAKSTLSRFGVTKKSTPSQPKKKIKQGSIESFFKRS